MKKIQAVLQSYFLKNKTRLRTVSLGQSLLIMFLLTATLPACRVKEGCASSQKGYTNNMERTKKRGKTALFPKSMSKKMKH